MLHRSTVGAAAWSPTQRAGSHLRPAGRRASSQLAATERCLMTDPGSSMSLTAVVVLTVVVLVAMAGWLGTVFFVAREPRSGGARPDGEIPGEPAIRKPAGVPAPRPPPARPARQAETARRDRRDIHPRRPGGRAVDTANLSPSRFGTGPAKPAGALRHPGARRLPCPFRGTEHWSRRGPASGSLLTLAVAGRDTRTGRLPGSRARAPGRAMQAPA